MDGDHAFLIYKETNANFKKQRVLGKRFCVVAMCKKQPLVWMPRHAMALIF